MDDSIELAEKLLEVGSVSQLVRALECRLTLGQGMGIAMERHELDEDEALQFLVFQASRNEESLRAAAQRLVDGRNEESERLDPHGLAVRRVERFPRRRAEQTA